MLAYAPQRRTAGAGVHSRHTLALVIAGHVALVTVALTTKMAIDIAQHEPPTTVTQIPVDPQPKPERIDKPQPKAQPNSHIDNPRPIVPPHNRDDQVLVDPGPALPIGPVAGTSVDPLPPIPLDPPIAPVKVAPRFATPDSLLRPPYPLDKLRADEEATLRLKLQIDEHGRVVAVDPVGAADPSFLQAARRHLLRNWRYKPATVDGRPVTASILVRLSFRLEDA